MWKAAGGAPELQEYLSMFLDKVNQGVTTLETVARICSENPAKLLGFFPRKGSIRVGSDADLVVCDMGLKQTFNKNRLYTKCKWSNYEGQTLQGSPIVTVLRGRIIMKDGKVIATPGDGKFLERGYGAS